MSSVDTPECGPNDVVIAPRFVGLCGTDIQVYRRGQEAKANVLGHEGVGVVTEVGKSVSSWETGEAVVFNPVNPVDPDEILGLQFDGVLQESILVESAETVPWLIQKIPHELMKPVGALIVPIATAIYSTRLVDSVGNDRNAVVVGDGPIALSNSIILRSAGYRSVQMVHGSSARSRWAVSNGYFDQRDVVSSKSDVPSRIVERLGGIHPDIAVICTPAEAVEQSANDALRYLKPNGHMNFVSSATPSVISLSTGDLDIHDLQRRNHNGISHSGSTQNFVSSDGKAVNVTGLRGVSFADIQASIDLLTENPRPFEKLITEVVELKHAVSLISSAVDWALGRRAGSRPMKAVIELDSDNYGQYH